MMKDESEAAGSFGSSFILPPATSAARRNWTRQTPALTFWKRSSGARRARKPISSSSAMAGASRRLRMATLSDSVRPTWPQANSIRSIDTASVL